MHKNHGSMGSYPGPPPAAPPSYTEAVRGVPPSSPFTPGQPVKHHGVRSEGPVIVTTVVPVGSQSTHTICPYCYHEISTNTKLEPGVIAYISGIIIAMLGGFCGCCLVPCCIDSCMDVHHTCPKCNRYLGRYRR